MAAGTKMTNAQIDVWLDANINTNGANGISGALLNEALKNFTQSTLFALLERKRNHAVTTGAPRSIVFDNAFPVGTVYNLIWRCKDSSGNDVAATVPVAGQTVSGFLITVTKDCVIDFTAIEYY